MWVHDMCQPLCILDLVLPSDTVIRARSFEMQMVFPGSLRPSSSTVSMLSITCSSVDVRNSFGSRPLCESLDTPVLHLPDFQRTICQGVEQDLISFYHHPSCPLCVSSSLGDLQHSYLLPLSFLLCVLPKRRMMGSYLRGFSYSS